MPGTTPTAVSPNELRHKAWMIQCAIVEALREINDMPPHPQRTILGRHLIDAFNIAREWDENGNMDSSKGAW